MSYMQEFEKELVDKLGDGTAEADVIKWVCEKVLESYRNGIKAGERGETVKRSGESRRRGSFGKAE